MAMDAITLALVVLLALIVILAFFFISTFNRLQSLKNGAEATLSQIRVAMKKRLDMVEQLVESTKYYAHFERDILERLTKMRASIGNASPEDLTKIYGASKGLVGNVMAVAESYPNLKTSEAVMATMSAIRDVEDEISRHRYTYNNITQEFNTLLDTFPSNIMASFTRARRMDYLNFEADELRRRGYLSPDASLEPGRPEVKWE